MPGLHASVFGSDLRAHGRIGDASGYRGRHDSQEDVECKTFLRVTGGTDSVAPAAVAVVRVEPCQ